MVRLQLGSSLEPQLNWSFFRLLVVFWSGLCPHLGGLVYPLAGKVTSWLWLGLPLLLLACSNGSCDDVAPAVPVRSGLFLYSYSHQPFIIPLGSVWSLPLPCSNNCSYWDQEMTLSVLVFLWFLNRRVLLTVFLKCLYCFNFYLIKFLLLLYFKKCFMYQCYGLNLYAPQNSCVKF